MFTLKIEVRNSSKKSMDFSQEMFSALVTKCSTNRIFTLSCPFFVTTCDPQYFYWTLSNQIMVQKVAQVQIDGFFQSESVFLCGFFKKNHTNSPNIVYFYRSFLICTHTTKITLVHLLHFIWTVYCVITNVWNTYMKFQKLFIFYDTLPIFITTQSLSDSIF